ncbi:hypothetical protein DXX93_15760 [Thalassotalea euphylliae]|uniref:Uncharacterized protein n=1 Tax=Thalassotalea euphylliae TaxID=1655234 RepID=A0A3E0TU29_9GAMM|nr:hypothetical protein [Thalassotalea euphylliae]REL27867.1 hypothetical protein DXX93_15760 [Thalassotalea euphylliae]
MNTKLKGITSAAAVSMIGLCFAVSHAAPTLNHAQQLHDKAQNKAQTEKYVVYQQVAIKYAPTSLPQHKHHQNLLSNSGTTFLVTDPLFHTPAFAQRFDKPLLQVPIVRVPIGMKRIGAETELKPKPPKTNDFLTLATVLNDKLQQLIAKFTHSSPSYSVNEHGQMALNKPSNETCKGKKARF